MGFSRGDVVLDRRISPLFGERPLSGHRALPSSVEVLRGSQAILQRSSQLRELCLRSGQAAALDNLEVWLDTPTARVKIPILVLVGAGHSNHSGSPSPTHLQGAVLIFEYKIAGRATGVLDTGDANGGHVFAAPAARAHIAEIAGRTLVQQGAAAVLISFEGTLQPGPQLPPQAAVPCRIATRQRTIPRYLDLAPTLEATLATLGNHTRRNFRYYRRRVERDFRVEFVPQVALTLDQFLTINRESINPVPREMALWRYQSLARLHQPVFSGLRCDGDQWLSLVAGHRQAAALVIDWQMNRAGLPRYSLSTVMRSFLMEHEIARGTRQLFFAGGTPHSMRLSFACTPVADVLVESRSAKARLLRRLAPWIFPPTNFLGQVLRDPAMHGTTG